MRRNIRRLIQTIALTASLSAAFVATAARASADEIDTYRDAMRDFAPVITAWTNDVDSLASASVAKPEIKCSAEILDLAARGNSMADDLSGTVAPAALTAQHNRLAGAVDALSVMSATACGAPVTLNAAIAHDLSEARAALVWIRHYTIRTPAPIRLDPPIPATGN